MTGLMLPDLPLVHEGRTREVYSLDEDYVLVVATDRITADDMVLPTPIPGKGRTVTALSRFWLELLQGTVGHPITTVPLRAAIRDRRTVDMMEGRAAVARRAPSIGVEAIVRGSLVGSSWDDYRTTGGTGDPRLANCLDGASPLPDPVISIAARTRHGGQWQVISPVQAADLVGRELTAFIYDRSLSLQRLAAAHAERRGVLLAESRFEFGLCDGQPVLISEALTPDSARLWDAATHVPGCPQPRLGKRHLDEYLEGVGWNGKSPAPTIPPAVVQTTAAGYRDVLETLTDSARPRRKTG